VLVLEVCQKNFIKVQESAIFTDFSITDKINQSLALIHKNTAFKNPNVTRDAREN
jgi:hypothetical protein